MFYVRAACVCAVLSCVGAVSTPVSAGTRPDEHAPLGVMGDHIHAKGEVMFSYRWMHMSMRDNRDGTDDLSPEDIVTSEPNRFGMPPTLRVVPTDMEMTMHMLGIMYAPTDSVTVMGMVNYLSNDMDHVTFAGPVGTTRLGRFSTSANGLSDVSLSALIRLNDHWHATFGIGLPVGDVDATDRILTPMGTRPSVRLPYPMQLGSGSVDAIVGLTAIGGVDHRNGWNWGGQWRSVFRTSDNDEDYRLGDQHVLTGWLSYLITPEISLSGRLAYRYRGDVRGSDSRIVAPVQTADPDRQRYSVVEAGLGANVVLGGGHRIAMELARPLYQDLHGPQLKSDWRWTVGWQYSP